MIGLRSGELRLVPHVEEWHALFETEAARIRGATGDRMVAVEHIGSTAICGISAKPILDLVAAVRDPIQCVPLLEEEGYEYRGDGDVAGRYYFVKGEPRTHHLHVFEPGNEAFRSHVLFRDLLRGDGRLAAEYERLKMGLAATFGNDRRAYTEGKAGFIDDVLRGPIPT